MTLLGIKDMDDFILQQPQQPTQPTQPPQEQPYVV